MRNCMNCKYYCINQSYIMMKDRTKEAVIIAKKRWKELGVNSSDEEIFERGMNCHPFPIGSCGNYDFRYFVSKKDFLDNILDK